MAKNTPSPARGSGPKSGSSKSPAPAPASGSTVASRIAQVESQLEEIRTSTIWSAREKVEQLLAMIEETNRRFEEFEKKSVTLDDLLGVKVMVDRHEAELVGLQRRRQEELGRVQSSEQAGGERLPIPMYSGDRSTLPRFLNVFFTWAISQKSEEALTHSVSVLMTGKKSRREMESKYGKRIVEKSLIVWSALTKAVEKDKIIADIVVGAKAPSEAWTILNSMIDDEDGEIAKEQAKTKFEELGMENGESIREYIGRAKSLASKVRYHGVEVSDHEISRRILNGLPSSFALEKRNFALRTDFSLADLEGGLVRVENLPKDSDGSDGSHALAAGLAGRGGRDGGRGARRGGGARGGSGRGKYDGRGHPPQHPQQQQQYDGRGRPPQQYDGSNIIKQVARRSGTHNSRRSSNIINSNGRRSSNSSGRRNSNSSSLTGSSVSTPGDGILSGNVSGAVNRDTFSGSAAQFSRLCH